MTVFSPNHQLQAVTLCSQVQPGCVGSWVVSMRFYWSSLLHLKKLEKMKPWHKVERWDYVPLHSFGVDIWGISLSTLQPILVCYLGILFWCGHVTPRTWVKAAAPLQRLLLGLIDRYLQVYEYGIKKTGGTALNFKQTCYFRLLNTNLAYYCYLHMHKSAARNTFILFHILAGVWCARSQCLRSCSRQRWVWHILTLVWYRGIWTEIDQNSGWWNVVQFNQMAATNQSQKVWSWTIELV